MDRYDDFKRLQGERNEQEALYEALLGLLRVYAKGYWPVDQDPTQWTIEELTQAINCITRMLSQEQRGCIESFGKGDFPKPRDFASSDISDDMGT
ncbi:MAG: hypothetical protein E6R05_01560 [Candidatus Moraniibacteriota bacterium]|nr:MAG: hypothetical protein E6R05_01560 [Candidatus Moranbacteria bacterium]